MITAKSSSLVIVSTVSTVSTVQSSLYVKMAIKPDLNGYLWKFCILKFDLDIHVSVHLNCSFSFVVSLQMWHANLLLIKKEEMITTLTCLVSKTKISSTLLIRWMFQGYLCESGIAIITWRVPLKLCYKNMFARNLNF